MGSAYRNIKDVDRFLSDDVIVWVDANGKLYSVKFFKEHIKGVIGVVDFNMVNKEADKTKNYLCQCDRYIDYRTNEARSRRFPWGFIPLKFAKKSELVCLECEILTSKTKPLFPTLGAVKTDYSATKAVIFDAMRTVPCTLKYPDYKKGGLSLNSLYEDLQRLKNHNDPMTSTKLEEKYDIWPNRGAITDICYHIKVATNDKVDLLTDKMKDYGVCMFDKKLYEKYPNYLTLV